MNQHTHVSMIVILSFSLTIGCTTEKQHREILNCTDQIVEVEVPEDSMHGVLSLVSKEKSTKYAVSS